MVRAMHGAGIEVILDVVYNHTAEGNQLGPDPLVPRHRQRGVLPAGRRDARVLHGLHGNRQLAQRQQPALAADDHGQPALLGDRDARRRVSGSTSPPPSPASSTTSTAWRPSSSSCSRTRSSRRSSSSPSRGMSAPAATRWATSRRCGRNGTGSTATLFATSGEASRRRSASSRRASPAAPTCTSTTGGVRSHPSTS